MEKIKIEKLKIEDVEKVFKLEKNIFCSASLRDIENTLKNENPTYYVLKIENEVIGFLESVIIEPEAEIYDIAISEEYRGKGYSKQLLQSFIDICKSKNIETIFLEVNTINYVAVNLYKKFGFKDYSTRKNYYGKNDAIMMKCDLI